jgi:hypothetical protein
MKRFILFVLVSFLVACSSNEPEYPRINYYVDIATVENPNQETAFFLQFDDNIRMKVTTSNIRYYRPKDGQRIIAKYSVLTNKAESSSYKHDIHLNNAYEVLTKGIFNITPETNDSIGNDYIFIEDIWVGGHFLNIEFVYPGRDKTHFISLVSDSSKTYNDGKIHLEFRHTANGDYPSINRWGMVSFDLKLLETNTAEQVDLVIHTNEFGSQANSYSLTYKYGASASARNTRSLKIGESKAVMR